MSDCTLSDHGQIKPGSGSRLEMPSHPTAQQMNKWDQDELLQWIQQKKPNLLSHDDLEKFTAAKFLGESFLRRAGDLDIFTKAGLPVGVSEVLANLGDEVKEGNPSAEDRKRKRDGETVTTESSNEPAKRKCQEQGEQEEQGEDDEEEVDEEMGEELDEEEVDEVEDGNDKDDNEGKADNDNEGDNEGDNDNEGGNDNDNSNDGQDDDDDDDDEEDGENLDVVRLADEPPHAWDRRVEIEKRIHALDEEHSNSPNPTYSKFPLPGAVALLSDPKREHVIPFPIVRMGTPGRFRLDKKYCWRYMGREKFADLLNELQLVQSKSNYKRLWVHGTSGYGKSHLLAALVCYLAALDNQVIYLPDCRLCLENPIEHLQTAMLFAWTDEGTQNEILTLDTEEKIKKFLGKQDDVLFVIDQMDALSEANTENNEDKVKLRALIDNLISSRKAVLGTSANDQEYLKRQISENNDRTMRVYGGFTKAEAEQWWKLHSTVDLGNHRKEDIEDLTGCVPLLLDSCVVNGKFDLDLLKGAEIKATTFSDNITMKTRDVGNEVDWNLYCDYVKACLTHSRVPDKLREKPHLIDHRYFFQREDKTGGYTCGIVRDAIAEELFQNEQRFPGVDFWKSIKKPWMT